MFRVERGLCQVELHSENFEGYKYDSPEEEGMAAWKRTACCWFILLLHLLFADLLFTWISGRLILVLSLKESYNPTQWEVAERTLALSPLTFFPSFPELGVGREVEVFNNPK